MNNLDTLLGQWRALTAARQAAVADTEAAIQSLSATMQETAAPFDEQLVGLEAEIRAVVMGSGKSYSANGVRATFRKGYERASWDDKALSGFAAAHPEILEFRKITKVKPSVKVEMEREK